MRNILLLTLIFLCSCTMAKVHHVEIIKFKFVPSDITINTGDTIIWTNKEKRQYHSVWFKATDEKEPDYLFPDETFEKKFESTGIQQYECGPHPKMKGSVNVVPINK